MKHRIALKVINKDCPSNYWDVCYHKETDKYIGIPHSGKHWYLILKAAIKLGETGKIALEAYKDAIEEVMLNKPNNIAKSAMKLNKTKLIYEI